MQAGLNTVGRYLSQNRVMLILTASWSAIILIAVLAMLSLLNPAAVNPIPSPTPELQVERPPASPPAEPNPTEFENPRALWSLFTAMAAAGCMAGALIILLGLRRALIQNAVFATSATTARPTTATAKAAKVPRAPKAPKVTTQSTSQLGQSRPPKANPKSTVKASQPRSAKATTKKNTAKPSSPVPLGVPQSGPPPAPVPLHLVPPPAPGPFSAGDTMRTQPVPTGQIVSPPPKRTKVAKAKAKAPAPPKSLTQPTVVVTQGGAPAIGVPGPPPSIPKVASLQKAAQKKAAQKKAAAQASAQQKAGKPPQKGHPQSQSARQGTPPPILSSLQAGVTIVPAEQTHPLDWHEHGIAEAMDMRKRRPLSSLMMRRR